MKKDLGFKLLYILVALVVIVNTAVGVYNSLFSNIEELPQGQKVYSLKSPSGENTLNIYVVNNCLGSAIRGELQSQEGIKNVYWQTETDKVDAYWADDESLIINNIPLNIAKGDDYDCRRGMSIFAEGSTYEQILLEEEGV